jgi:copper(I)-binding protein
MTYISKLVIMTNMKKSLSLLCGLFLTINVHAFMSGVSPEKDGGPKLVLLEGVIHKGPPSSSVTVGYGIIKNNTDNDLVITGVRSPVYDEVQIHSMEYSNSGTAKMIHQKTLLIPARQEITLESGGLHLMLMGPRRDIEVGQEIKVMVRDKQETRYMFNLTVIDPRHNHGSYDHHMH